MAKAVQTGACACACTCQRGEKSKAVGGYEYELWFNCERVNSNRRRPSVLDTLGWCVHGDTDSLAGEMSFKVHICFLAAVGAELSLGLYYFTPVSSLCLVARLGVGLSVISLSFFSYIRP